MTVKFRRNLWQYQKGKLYMYVIIIYCNGYLYKYPSNGEQEWKKDLHVKVEKI